MKRQKKTPEEFTSILNGFRMQHQGEEFTSSELCKKLVELGFGKNVAYSIMLKSFPFVRVGNEVKYTLPKEPIHKSIVLGAIQKQRDLARGYAQERKKKLSVASTVSTLDSALEAVKAAGYRISKPVFDHERFAKEHPEIAAQYIKYENI